MSLPPAFHSLTLRSLAQFMLLLFPLSVLLGKAALNVCCVMVVALFLWHVVSKRDWQIFNKTWVKCAFAYWALQMFSALWALDGSAAFYAGLVWGRYVLFGIAAAYWLLNDEVIQRRFLIAMALYVAFLSVDGIYQYYHGTDIFGEVKYNQYANKNSEGVPLIGDRLTGPFNKPIAGAAMMYFIFPIVLLAMGTGLSRRQRIVTSVLSVLGVYMIILSGERGPMLLTLFGFFLIFVLFSKQKKRWGIVGILALLVALPFVQTRMLDNAAAGSAHYLIKRQIDSTWKVISDLPNSAYGRIWQDALQLASEHPLLGVGEMNIRVHWCDRQEMKHFTGGCPLHPHNTYLEVLANTGIVGLGLYVLTVFFIFRYFWSNRNLWWTDALACGIFITLCIRFWPLMAATSYMRAISSFSLWLMVGWGIAVVELLREKQITAPRL